MFVGPVRRRATSLHALQRYQRRYACKPRIQVRDVPVKVHRIHRRRAAEAGQSLQEFLLPELVEGARARTPAEVVAEIEGHVAGTATADEGS